VVVEDALQAADLADRPQRGAAELAHALRDRIRRGVELIGLLVEEQVVIAEVRTRGVPVEVLGLQIEREEVREQEIHRRRYVLRRRGPQIRGRLQRNHASGLRVGPLHSDSSFFGSLHIDYLPPEPATSIDRISSFVVGISRGATLSPRKPIRSSVGIASSRPASSPQIVTGLPEASSITIPSKRSSAG